MRKSIIAALTSSVLQRNAASSTTSCVGSEGSSQASASTSSHANKLQHLKTTTGCDEVDEDIEDENALEYEATRKLLERKIEQAPAAKVIVSDAMMREAISEINARKSALLVESVSLSADNNNQGYDPETHSEVAEPIEVQSKSGDGGMPQQNSNSEANAADFELNDGSNRCPLEKVLEFLQAVMSKDYKRALVLAKEVEKYEPDNETVKEYMTVLRKIVDREHEDEEAEGSESDSYTDVSSSEDEDNFSDEMTTSSETESVSGDGGENAEEARSTTSGEDEDDDLEDDNEPKSVPYAVLKKMSEEVPVKVDNARK